MRSHCSTRNKSGFVADAESASAAFVCHRYSLLVILPSTTFTSKLVPPVAAHALQIESVPGAELQYLHMTQRKRFSGNAVFRAVI